MPSFDDATLVKIDELFHDDEGEDEGPVTRGLFERQVQLLLKQNKLLEQNQSFLRRISFAATLVIILIFINIGLITISLLSSM